jgi:anti-sigma factor RsiW
VWCDVDPSELSAFIDGETTSDRGRTLAAHVAECASCRAELDRSRRTDDAIRRSGPEPALAAIRSDLDRRLRGMRWRSRLRVGLPIGAAAAAIVIGLQLAPSRGGPPTPPIDAARPAVRAPQIEALELDAASLRLSLAAENPEPAVRRGLDARLDAIVDRIEKLRLPN